VAPSVCVPPGLIPNLLPGAPAPGVHSSISRTARFFDFVATVGFNLSILFIHTGGARPRISGLPEIRVVYDGRMETTQHNSEDFLHGGLTSFRGLTIMILTGMTGIGAIWEFLKRRPFCM
jgi:hypothetical protein